MADSDSVAVPKSVLWQLGFFLFGSVLSGVATAIWLAASAEGAIENQENRIGRAIELIIRHERDIAKLQGQLEALRDDRTR